MHKLTVVSKVVMPLQTYTKMSASEQCSITLASVSLLMLRPGLHRHTHTTTQCQQLIADTYNAILPTLSTHVSVMYMYVCSRHTKQNQTARVHTATEHMPYGIEAATESRVTFCTLTYV